jgi:hypothetical protein
MKSFFLVVAFLLVQCLAFSQSGTFDADPDTELKEVLKLDAIQVFKWDSIRQEYNAMMTDLVKSAVDRDERNRQLIEMNNKRESKQVEILNIIQKEKYASFKEKQIEERRAEQIRHREERMNQRKQKH